MSNTINCIVLIAFVKISLCSQPVVGAIDSLVQDYLNAEKNLWHLVRSTNVNSNNNDDTLLHIYIAHNAFLHEDFGEDGSFDALSKQERSNLDENQRMDGHVKLIIDSIRHINITTLNVRGLLDRNEYEYLPLLMTDIAENIPKMTATLVKYVDLNFWHSIKNNSQVCHPDVVHVRSENQVLVAFYGEVVAALLKSHMLLQMTHMVQTVNNLGNFHDADILRENFAYNVTTMQNEVRSELNNASRAVWSCDPDDFHDEDSFIEISKFYQGYIDNEINLNPHGKCDATCEEYVETKHYPCADCLPRTVQESQLICNGTVLNCQYFDGSVSICPSELGSPRRYKFLEYDDGRIVGGESNCNRLQQFRAEPWWNWLVHCSNCFCYCEDPNAADSDRYFSLRPAVSNTKENKVISGVKLIKINRVIHFAISEKELLPNGRLVEAFDTWRPSNTFSIDDYDIEEGVDFHTISLFNRSIDLDTVIDADRVVTGVRFRVVNSHLRIEVRATNFNYQTGQLIDIQRSEWIHDKSPAKKMPLELQSPDRSTRSQQKSIPIRGINQHYISFQPSDIWKDAAQSTVPFIDTTPVVSKTPLVGLGIYYKTRYRYGGFLAPHIIPIDASLHMTPINTF